MASFLILTLPLILLLIPIVFQVVVGRKILNEKTTFAYVLVSLGSLLMEVLMTALGLFISMKGQMMKGITCLSPGVIGFGFLAIFTLIVVIIIQVISDKLN